MKRLWIGLLVTASGCTLIRSLLPEERPVGMPADAIQLGRGGEVMAGAIGVQQVLNGVRANLEDAGSLAPDGGVQDGGAIPDDILPYHRCFLDPSSYQVWVQPRDGGSGWLVRVLPKAWCFGYGGGGEFEIDGESFEILRGELYE